jgi:adenylate kinase
MQGVFGAQPKIRIPKPEIREIRSPKSETAVISPEHAARRSFSDFGLRPSFGARISDLVSPRGLCGRPSSGSRVELISDFLLAWGVAFREHPAANQNDSNHEKRSFMSDHMQRDRTTWLKDGKAECKVKPPKAAKPWHLVLLGAPGIGKGTQADLLSQKLGACQLSTGDLFRAAKTIAECERSPAIREALDYMKAGKLVPDSTVVALVQERIHCLHCEGSFLLDGFPRTVAQAEALTRILGDEKLTLDGVLSYELPLQKILDRLSGRRTCEKCKAIFHVKDLPPRVDGVCDHCGGRLYQREDDRPEAIRVRLETYDKSTAPLIDYYSRQGLLVRVECGEMPQDTFQRTLTALKINA